MRRLIDACGGRGQVALMGGIGNEKLVATYYQAIAACCDYAAEKNSARQRETTATQLDRPRMPQVDRKSRPQELRPLV